MMGKDFWEDVEIDAIVVEEEISRLAKLLFEQYGDGFDEIDVLQMNNAPGTPRGLILQQVLKLVLEEKSKVERSPGL